MAEPFIAEIRMFPFAFAPQGWAKCEGQVLPVAQNTALYSVIGAAYGGDGESEFALPDMRGSVPMHPGEGPGLTPRSLAEASGSEAVALNESELPVHAHALRAQTEDPADVRIISEYSTFGLSQGGPIYQPSGNDVLASQALTSAGGGEPHNNLMPYITFCFNIALQGEIPERG
jgi:microcystin-dependent protein